ncbi:MAG: serine/threonine protein kinase, partial [Planctomycetales bacterium]|nr:serine/threonine protein kinase [Planctomycetales bacterium]
METINGRFLPDDSDRETPQEPLPSEASGEQCKNDHTVNQTTPSTGPVSKRARLKRQPTNGGETRSNSGLSGSQDRYIELGELGRGGWGIVQRALDRQLQREVAIKRISNAGKIRAAERDQFLHEARITSGLQHPGVVPVHELVADQEGDTYYVMKLLEGDTLRHHIRLTHEPRANGKWKRYELVEAITPLLLRFINVCHAVAYAHRCGIIHRDLKPANVMAGAFGETIVVDWGLARYINDKSDETTIQGPTKPDDQSGSHRSSAPIESEGSVIGTPTYMSPEQARGELASLGSHSDIYSLGVILYEIVAGHHPHRGMDIKTVLRRARQGEYEPLSNAQPCVPRALESIVQTAMSADPEKRYKDVETLADDVGRFMTGQQVSVHSENLAERGIRWCNRHRAVASTIAIAVTVLMIVSVISTIVIRSAHQAERVARAEAAKAHHEALERLVDARDTADTWLVDLSGSLQFHPAMTPLRRELIQQALIQYARLIEFQITPINSLAESELSQDAARILSLEWLERAKCHLRLGDLKRMDGNDDEALTHYSTAEGILQELQQNAVSHDATPKEVIAAHAMPAYDLPENAMRVNSVSMNSGDTSMTNQDAWMQYKGQINDLIQVEKINALIGTTMATNKLPSIAQSLRCREQLQQWIPLAPPADAKGRPSDFVGRVISAMIRFEITVQRISATAPNSSNNVFSPERYKNAVAWARWLAHERGKPN